MPLLLGIDLGTSYLKAGVFDLAGNLRGLERVAAGVEEPRPGRRELDAAIFLSRLRDAVTLAIREAGARKSDVVAISYGSQANSFLLLDDENSALTPLIFWNDLRAHPLPEELREFGVSDERRGRTGLWELVPESAPAKVRWLQREAPGTWRRCRSVMTVSDYLTFFLTGERVGDASTAALTGLYDITQRVWWEDALERFGLTASHMSVPLLPGSKAGVLTPAAAGLFGLEPGTVVAAGALDHHAAAIGSGLGFHVEASLSSGTVLAAIVLVKGVAPMPECIFGPHPGEPGFYALAYDPNGAGRLEEYQKRFAPEVPMGELMACLEKPGGVLAAQHAGNLRRQLREMAETEKLLLGRISPNGLFRRIAATGGGAKSPVSLQIMADVFGVPVMSTSPEPACLGAAALAAVGAGLYGNLGAALARMVRPARILEPSKA